MKKRLSSLLLAVLCAVMMAVPAMAYARVDTGADTSLTIVYKSGETALKDVSVKIYKVLEMSDAVRFTPTETFKDYAGMMDLVNQAKWPDLASNLASYLAAATTPVVPSAASATDAEGKVSFGNNVTDVGVYLVAADTKVEGRTTYTFAPFFVTLPLLNATNDTWEYDAAVAAKVASQYNPPSYNPDPFSIGVRKVWEDAEAVAAGEVERPASVSVSLLKNGQVYDTVTLSDANSWTYTWNNMDKTAAWAIIENDVPEGYTSLVTQHSNTFKVTNTAEPMEDLPDGDVPLEDLPDEDVPLGGLPQTGIPWLPVQILTTAGILLFAAGYIVLRRGRRDEHEI